MKVDCLSTVKGSVAPGSETVEQRPDGCANPLDGYIHMHQWFTQQRLRIRTGWGDELPWHRIPLGANVALEYGCAMHNSSEVFIPVKQKPVLITLHVFTPFTQASTATASMSSLFICSE